MGGRKNSYGRYGITLKNKTKSQADYIAEVGHRRLRGMIAYGGTTRYMPKYPSIAYRPESRLFGLQGLGTFVRKLILQRNFLHLKHT